MITFEENGVSMVFNIDLKPSESEEKKNQGIMAELHAQRKVQRSDLPKKVTVPANFFEKLKNIWSD